MKILEEKIITLGDKIVLVRLVESNSRYGTYVKARAIIQIDKKQKFKDKIRYWQSKLAEAERENNKFAVG